MCKEKICVKCKTPFPLSEFYFNKSKGLLFNNCKRCTIAGDKKRKLDKLHGVYINKSLATVPADTGILKHCKGPCGSLKDQSSYREYITKVNGKEYKYYAHKCRACEAAAEKEKRFTENLFDENDYKKLMNF